MLASKISAHMDAVTDKQLRAAMKRAAKRATQPPPTRTLTLTPAAFTSTEAQNDRALDAIRKQVPALLALITLFPGDCSHRATDYHHRDESPDTRGERRRPGGRLQACPRISPAEGHAAALRAAR